MIGELHGPAISKIFCACNRHLLRRVECLIPPTLLLSLNRQARGRHELVQYGDNARIIVARHMLLRAVVHERSHELESLARGLMVA